MRRTSPPPEVKIPLVRDCNVDSPVFDIHREFFLPSLLLDDQKILPVILLT